MKRFSYYHLVTVIAVVLLATSNAEAQTSVILKAAVSETVALSVLPSAGQSNVQIERLNGGNTVRLTLSGTDAVIRVPLLVRSNSGFKISAAFESETAVLSELSLVDARPTGTWVSPAVVHALELKPQFDPDLSRPLHILTGPRISVGGTLDSPNNALQITLLIRVKPRPTSKDGGGLVHLTFVGTAN